MSQDSDPRDREEGSLHLSGFGGLCASLALHPPNKVRPPCLSPHFPPRMDSTVYAGGGLEAETEGSNSGAYISHH